MPAGVGKGGTVPLLVSLHGLGGTGKVQNTATHWSDFADEQSSAGSPFVVALPNGIASLWAWGAEDSYDVRFLFALVARLVASGCVDPARVYFDGWSEGAYMAQRMACAVGDPAVAGSDIGVTAIAAYAGGNPGTGTGSCGVNGKPVQIVRLLLSQGLADQIVDPQSTGFAAFESWAPRYSCEAPKEAFDHLQQLHGCRDGATAAWWPIAGQAHIVWSCRSDPEWHNRGIWAFLTLQTLPTDTTCA